MSSKYDKVLKEMAKKHHVNLTYINRDGNRRYKSRKRICKEILKKAKKSKSIQYMKRVRLASGDDDDEEEEQKGSRQAKRPTAYPFDVPSPPLPTRDFDADRLANREQPFPKPVFGEHEQVLKIHFDRGYEQFKKMLSQYPPSNECRGENDDMLQWLVYRANMLSQLGLKSVHRQPSSHGACVLPVVLQEQNVGDIHLKLSAKDMPLQDVDWENTVLAIQTCAKTHRFIMFSVGMSAMSGLHANIAILDSVLGTLERFDPNGTMTFMLSGDVEKEIDQQMKIIVRIASVALQKSVSYLSTQHVCPTGWGPQTVAEDLIEQIPECEGQIYGYCIIFSLLYADLHMQFPDVSPDKIIDQLLSEDRRDLTMIARRYLGYIRSLLPRPDSPENIQARLVFAKKYLIPYLYQTKFGGRIVDTQNNIVSHETELKQLTSIPSNYLSKEGHIQLKKIYDTLTQLMVLQDNLFKLSKLDSLILNRFITKTLIGDFSLFDHKLERGHFYNKIVVEFLIQPITQIERVLERKSADKTQLLQLLDILSKFKDYIGNDWPKYNRKYRLEDLYKQVET